MNNQLKHRMILATLSIFLYSFAFYGITSPFANENLSVAIFVVSICILTVCTIVYGIFLVLYIIYVFNGSHKTFSKWIE